MIVEYIIENKVGILIYPAGKRELLFEIKKRKVKNWKNCLKLLGILDEQEPSVQSAEQVWDWGNMYLSRHGKGPSQHWYLKINSGFHAKKNSKQQYLKVVMLSDPSFSKKRIYVYDHAA